MIGLTKSRIKWLDPSRKTLYFPRHRPLDKELALTVSAQQIVDKFGDLLRPLSGDLKIEISGPCSQESPTAGGIVFTKDSSLLERLENSEVAAIVVHDKLSEIAQTVVRKKTLIAAKDSYFAMALVNRAFFSPPYHSQPFASKMVHDTAVIHSSAKIDPTAIIGPFAVISAGSRVGARTYIGANSVIDQNAVIGDDSIIHAHVYIGHTCQIGSRCEIHPNCTIGKDGFGYAKGPTGLHQKIPHYGAVQIENDVSIGANCVVDRGTFEPAIIGEGTKIDNLCHFGHNIRIGKNCIITAGFMTAGSVTIGNNCVFGGRTSINGHIEICDNVMIGPMSGVTGTITQPGVYGGYPVIPMKEHLKAHASIQHLPRLRKSVARMLKHLGMTKEEE